MLAPIAAPDSPIASAKKPKCLSEKKSPQPSASVGSPKMIPNKLFTDKERDSTSSRGISTGTVPANGNRSSLFSPFLKKSDDVDDVATGKPPTVTLSAKQQYFQQNSANGTSADRSSLVTHGTSSTSTLATSSSVRSGLSLPSINTNVPSNNSSANNTPTKTASAGQLSNIDQSRGVSTTSSKLAPNGSQQGAPSASHKTVGTSSLCNPSNTTPVSSPPSSPTAATRKVEVRNYQQQDDDDDEDEFNPYHFMYQLPPHNTVKLPNKIVLPPNNSTATPRSRPITLVLDLDETLVHCSVEPIPNPDVVFPVVFNNTTYQVYVRKRPFLDSFLEAITKNYEVVLFTASQKVYADKLLDYIDPEKKCFHHRLFRDSCLNVLGNFIKDLEVLGRNLSKTVLVDNSPYAYAYQIDNGIPIESWYDDDRDEELLKLLGFLKSRLDGVQDVRPIVREHFKTRLLIEEAVRGASMRQLIIPGF